MRVLDATALDWLSARTLVHYYLLPCVHHRATRDENAATVPVAEDELPAPCPPGRRPRSARAAAHRHRHFVTLRCRQRRGRHRVGLSKRWQQWQWRPCHSHPGDSHRRARGPRSRPCCPCSGCAAACRRLQRHCCCRRCKGRHACMEDFPDGHHGRLLHQLWRFHGRHGRHHVCRCVGAGVCVSGPRGVHSLVCDVVPCWSLP